MRRAKRRIFRDNAGQWRFQVKAGNGEILATSEAYTRRRDALRGFDDLVSAIKLDLEGL